MPQTVQKRDGSVESFQVEKLKNSLRKAATQANYPPEKVSQVVEEISSYVLDSVKDLENVDTQSMRTLILNKLAETYPEVFESWLRYDREIKGRND